MFGELLGRQAFIEHTGVDGGSSLGKPHFMEEEKAAGIWERVGRGIPSQIVYHDRGKQDECSGTAGLNRYDIGYMPLS
jgi:hypothetical protein